MKVLIIEDDKFMAESLATKFKEANFAIAHLKNGNEVVEEMIIQKPDIVILDILLPGKNGFDVLKELKEKEETKNVPVIIVSNLGSKEDFEKGSRLGASGFMVKATVIPEDVVAKAKQVIAGITLESR
ncbi:MAG: Response regulator receiver protein [Parcubacteria group bacterium GW2011_GWB1_44_7]|nr:MAG: Response regulator receiver protein [Parcubacteria group bacterium GW2011_GWB1_44_7]